MSDLDKLEQAPLRVSEARDSKDLLHEDRRALQAFEVRWLEVGVEPEHILRSSHVTVECQTA
eukprot:1883624-Rhodomonas_salina.2